MLSYGMGKFLAEFLTGAFASLVFKFYETEIGLSAGLVAGAIVLYSAWNAVNDPLIGFLTAKPTGLSARLGRRFPWITIGSFASALAFILVFLPPRTSSILTFLWLLFTICLYDTFYSLWEVNYQSIFPDRFRTQEARAKAAGFATLVGVLGVAGGAVLPTLIIRYGQPRTFLANAVVFAFAGSLAAILLLPGVRETPDMVRRFIEQEAKARQVPNFKAQLKAALGRRNFLAFIILYFFYQSATISMTASIHYVGDYLLGGKSTTLIFAGMLAGALAGIPFWLVLRKKIPSTQRLLALSAIALAVFCIPLMFARGYWSFVGAMFFWGIAFGGFWMLMTPALADIIDEIVVTTGRRDDGVYIGFRAFAGRLAYSVQALSFWIVHSLTAFQAEPRGEAAKFGIRLHTALIPAVLLVIGVIVFLKMNTLSAEKTKENREILRTMKL
ncbi:MAG: major facilitator superfamily MFS1 [Spirochaetes bacterium]|nr:MAG: major facilitator superfamily MFS1 [Spirochaetota bacterium]